jgi:hypothetical protein
MLGQVTLKRDFISGIDKVASVEAFGLKNVAFSVEQYTRDCLKISIVVKQIVATMYIFFTHI